MTSPFSKRELKDIERQAKWRLHESFDEPMAQTFARLVPNTGNQVVVVFGRIASGSVAVEEIAAILGEMPGAFASGAVPVLHDLDEHLARGQNPGGWVFLRHLASAAGDGPIVTRPCPVDGVPIPQRTGSGRQRVYCSARCRQRAHRSRPA